MTRLQLHIFQASLSNVHHLSGYRDLCGAMSFQSCNFVHSTHLYTHCFRHQKNGLLVLDSKVGLIQKVERNKWFLVHFEVLHRPRMNPQACASWQPVDHLASPLPSLFCFLFWFCGFSLFCRKVNLLLVRPCGSTASD